MKQTDENSMRLFTDPGVTLTAVKAAGTHITTKEYGELVDMESGCWAAVLGHCNEEISQCINDYSGTLFHTNQLFRTEHPSALTAEITKAAGLKSTYKGTYMSSGSDAVSLAVKLAEELTGRSRKLSFTISSHGSSPEFKLPRNQEQWCDLTITDCLHCDKCISCKECGKFETIDFEQMAAFVFEAGNSGGLVLCPPDKLITHLSENIRKAGGFIIVNEVTTGFGRTGRWFGFQNYQTFLSAEGSPDFIAIGKGLGNGYPISGVLVKSHMADHLMRKGYHYVQSHTDDPLGCILARKVVEIMVREDMVERGNRAGEYLRAKLEELKETIRSNYGINEIRGRGMMNVVELESGHKAVDVFHELLENGFFTGYNERYNLIHLYAPLILVYEDIDRFCKVLKEILQKSLDT